VPPKVRAEHGPSESKKWLWRDNDAKLKPLAQRSFLVKEAAAG
jgi:hypothetical protein